MLFMYEYICVYMNIYIYLFTILVTGPSRLVLISGKLRPQSWKNSGEDNDYMPKCLMCGTALLYNNLLSHNPLQHTSINVYRGSISLMIYHLPLGLSS